MAGSRGGARGRRRLAPSERGLLAACAGLYLAACVAAEAVAPMPRDAPLRAGREKAGVTTPAGHEWPELVRLGTYTCYAYCPCERCCGQWSGGPTASGTMPEEGRTVAADWSVLPPGTEIYIENVGWRMVEDTGSGITGDALDLYMESHDAARAFGVQRAGIYIRDKEDEHHGAEHDPEERDQDLLPLPAEG